MKKGSTLSFWQAKQIGEQNPKIQYRNPIQYLSFVWGIIKNLVSDSEKDI